MSATKLSFVLSFALIYLLYESYNRQVEPFDFAVTHRRKINAESNRLFDFLVLTHVLEKWFPGDARLREADAKTLGVGKYFGISFEVPLIGKWNAYFATTDYKRGKLLALESDDGIINPRFELRTESYHDKSFLQVTVYLRKSSAVFQYTVGGFIRSITKRKFEETMGRVEEMYESTEKYRELT
ncbi:uncharacterized protein LOC105690374 [Athalia rosae]|uniref:uncharacterized protein LOC105690374 n=1 Tax=Athalia rosae TaxID=37344 RepID=UPI002034293A|nr:uncharacterized protein LOC105690374 [Athalia rosae]